MADGGLGPERRHLCDRAGRIGGGRGGGKWLLDLLRLPAQASFGFTTGCQTAHFTALAAARDHLLRQRGWDVAVDGMAGAPPLRVFVTAMHHVSVDRALRYLGIGSRQLTVSPVAADGRLEPATLESALAASDSPSIVALATPVT